VYSSDKPSAEDFKLKELDTMKVKETPMGKTLMHSRKSLFSAKEKTTVISGLSSS